LTQDALAGAGNVRRSGEATAPGSAVPIGDRHPMRVAAGGPGSPAGTRCGSCRTRQEPWIISCSAGVRFLGPSDAVSRSSLPREPEPHRIVGDHRRAGVGPDVEGLDPADADEQHTGHVPRGHNRPVHRQRAGAALAKAGLGLLPVERQRLLARGRARRRPAC